MARLPKGIRLRKDGKYESRFTYEGKRYSAYGSTPKECEAHKIQYIVQLKDTLYIKNKDITLSKYIEEWRKTRIGTIRESTEFTTEVRLNNIIKYLGKKKIVELERREVVKFQQDLAKELTTAGVNYTVSLLRTILNSAINDKIVTCNACNGIKALQRIEPLARDTTHRALTEEEQELFFRYAKGYWYYEFFAFMVSTGCRIGEASALTWQDIDYSNNVIHITKTTTKTNGKGYKVGEHPKTNSGRRDIPLTDGVKAILTAQREKLLCTNGGKVIQLDGRIFRKLRNDSLILPINVISEINCILDKVEKEDGRAIARFTAHAFRATFATRAIEQGMTPQTLKTILGHSQLRVTMDLYAHVLPNTKAQEMNLISIVV